MGRSRCWRGWVLFEAKKERHAVKAEDDEVLLHSDYLIIVKGFEERRISIAFV
jgi:hypothetical protein